MDTTRLNREDWIVLFAAVAGLSAWLITGENYLLFPSGMFVGAFLFRLGYLLG